jgi:hypothetical protein
MNRRRVRWGVVAGLIAAAVLASCGGGDGDEGAAQEADSAEVSTDATATEADGAAETDAADPTDTTAVATTVAEDEPSDEPAGDETPNCDAIFSMSEMEEFFAEPVALTEETNDSLGQLVCTWESIEDPDDPEDMAFKILVLQFYSGDPIGAASFFDPSIYESVTTIEGIGDLAYTSDELGMTFNFVDEPVGGSLSYTELDMGDVDAPKLHTSADVEQLFRTFHDRVT